MDREDGEVEEGERNVQTGGENGGIGGRRCIEGTTRRDPRMGIATPDRTGKKKAKGGDDARSAREMKGA